MLPFDPENQNSMEIGSDLGAYVYFNGIRAMNVYLVMFIQSTFLKIIPMEGRYTDVQILKDTKRPKDGYGI